MSLILPIKLKNTSASRAAQEIRDKVQANWLGMVSAQIEIFERLWKSKEYGAQEVLDELGSDATQLFQLGAANVGTILSVKPDALTEAQWKPPFLVEFNADGTVKITDKPNS